MPVPQFIQSAERIVIKVGSALLADIASGMIKESWIDALSADICTLHNMGKDVILVSSGGIALGRNAIGIPNDMPPQNIRLELKQAASAVGQFHMFSSYYKSFSAAGMQAAQVLLTMSETENRRMHLNARATLCTLMEKNIIPIINENDTVSTGEIRFGDNDRLAVRVGQMVQADLVILLSTTDGLYTDNPHYNPQAQHIPCVEEITDEHKAMAGDAVPGLSTGGMKSKVEAAIAANEAGIHLLIANGIENGALGRVCGDSAVRSTMFTAQKVSKNAKKLWIQSHVRPKGSIFIDKGAFEALSHGKSLLPVGVCAVDGTFKRGDAVTIYNEAKEKIAVGLCAYGSDEAGKIMRRSSKEIAEILGYGGRKELVHRDDLVLLKEKHQGA